MDRETAQKILDATKRIDGILSELDLISDEITNDAQRETVLRGIAHTALVAFHELTREVCLEYPDLDPDFPNGDRPGDRPKQNP